VSKEQVAGVLQDQLPRPASNKGLTGKNTAKHSSQIKLN